MRVQNYFQPQSLKELVDCLGWIDEKSLILAGGTDLIIQQKNHPSEITNLLSLCRVPELYGIGIQAGPSGENMLRIGAMETHDAIAHQPDVQRCASALSQACDHVGSQQIRNKGTIGGSLGNASVAGDMIPVLYLYHAQIETICAGGGSRFLAADDLIAGVGRTNLDMQELIRAVWLPLYPERQSCFVKLGGRKEVTIADLSLSLLWEREDGHYHNVQGVLGAVDVRPVRIPETMDIFEGSDAGPMECERLADSLEELIRKIRQNRKRPPKLRIREGEPEYKERAIRGVVYDAAELMWDMTADAGR